MGTMDELELRKISSTAELRNISSSWDDLWQRSEVYSPKAKANHLALWVDSFAAGSHFEAIVLEQSNGRLVAALPMISLTVKGLFRVLSLATSYEVMGGDFLLDPCCDQQKAADLIVEELARASLAFLYFPSVAFQETRWQELLHAFKRAKLLADVKTSSLTGQVKVQQDWHTYEMSLPAKHRNNQRRLIRRLEESGDTRFIFMKELDPSKIESLLLQGFNVENSSWKGKAGTSVLKTPGYYEYFYKDSFLLAKEGHLALAFLMHKGNPIAFSHFSYAKGVYWGEKIGVDESYKKYGPGKQVVARFLKYLHELPEPSILDFNGPLVSWTEKWANHTYPVGRIYVTTRKRHSKILFWLYFRLSAVRKMIRKGESISDHL